MLTDSATAAREATSRGHPGGVLGLALAHCFIDACPGALPALLPILQASLGLNYTSVALIGVTSAVTSSLLQPAFGFLTDRRSLLFFLPLGCVVAAFGIGLVTLAPSFLLV